MKAYKLQVWLTEEEKVAILEEAKEKGMNMSEVVRSRAFRSERQQEAYNTVIKRLMKQGMAGDTEALFLVLDLAGTTREEYREKLEDALTPGEIDKARHPEAAGA